MEEFLGIGENETGEQTVGGDGRGGHHQDGVEPRTHAVGEKQFPENPYARDLKKGTHADDQHQQQIDSLGMPF
jgi:hypothetical protein